MSPLSHVTEYVWDGQNLVSETEQGTTDTYTYDMTGVHTRKHGNIVTSYLKDYHGNVIGSADSTGRLDYDAYGNQLQGDAPDPFGYCGEYYDSETGLIYLRNRYYDPTTGRFINEDPIKDGLNWYMYCEGNPIMFVDPTGWISWEKASEIIKRNADAIINAGNYYKVNPAIIAACIYTEQCLNVNWIDSLTDKIGYRLDTSIGIGQVKISTAKLLEDSGYIAKTEYSRYERYGYVFVVYWKAPGVGEVVANSREEAISYRLSSESENVNYVAAYLRYFQDRWENVCDDIDGKTDILATLFNQGEKKPPHPNPKPNPFGEQAKKEYEYMRKLLGLSDE